MTSPSYARPPGGLPPQTDKLASAATFTPAYAVIPASVQRDIVTSFLPGWRETRFWVLARPLSGFAETFSHYIAELAPGGGTTREEGEEGVQSALFLTHGAARLDIGGETHLLTPGSFCYIPPSARWSLTAEGEGDCVFHWHRKRYQPVDGLDAPAFLHRNEQEITPTPMPSAPEWATTRFVDPADLAFDFHITIVTLQPGASIPFLETHVMEHGLYVLEGKGAYRLNADWVEVGPGDYMWLRAFCPQACYAGGPGPFRYLLYKDVNRHAVLPPVPHL
ncbi:(S)-ureidoglycine aminohydrolase [Oceanicola sp. D3]|uniref:bifunctional allantoicase/(S)-ureidoglycine aminohydrolase n=1 Tax=Oceanicola sp. D3 TaxID=2587163 RepID=UPI001122318F|nr:bifunctional allantoicase/(S)-ureidoglycine aminohydrolase [Oceanicola sp. D3]QDC08868.1 (S)-ureidoglycine aminohydrolase [Oceanicola sp. D3]